MIQNWMIKYYNEEDNKRRKLVCFLSIGSNPIISAIPYFGKLVQVVPVQVRNISSSIRGQKQLGMDKLIDQVTQLHHSPHPALFVPTRLSVINKQIVWWELELTQYNITIMATQKHILYLSRVWCFDRFNNFTSLTVQGLIIGLTPVALSWASKRKESNPFPFPCLSC